MKHIYDLPQFGENWFTYPKLYTRMVEDFPTGSRFVEVGSWKGKSASYLAVEIINSAKDIKLDCVDTWQGSAEHIDDEYVKANTLFELFLNNVSSFRPVITPVRMDSISASKTYEDASIDFLFIDASHDYDSVKNDIEAWFPKVKPGGTIAGHDYDCWDGVTKAVDEFFVGKPILTGEHCWVYNKPLMSLPSVSIIVTCKGRLSYLKQTLPTFEAQYYRGPIEVIVVDYGCPDGTAEWCKNLPVRCIKTDDEYFNMSRARNIGACRSSADILAFVDSHNMLSPSYIQKVVEALATTSMVHPDTKPGSTSFRRSLYHEIRGFDEGLIFYGCDDTDFHRRAANAGHHPPETIDSDLINVLHHTDEEKLRYYANKDLYDNIRINELACSDLSRSVNPNGYGKI